MAAHEEMKGNSNYRACLSRKKGTVNQSLASIKSKEFFPHRASPHPRRGKTSSCRKKNCRHTSAFGLPQHLHIELMCGAAENRRWSPSASSGVGFSQLAARLIAPVAPPIALKCFH
jgi:hypothetical protein